jgi:hypothetical protein
MFLGVSGNYQKTQTTTRNVADVIIRTLTSKHFQHLKRELLTFSFFTTTTKRQKMPHPVSTVMSLFTWNDLIMLVSVTLASVILDLNLPTHVEHRKWIELLLYIIVMVFVTLVLHVTENMAAPK